MINARFLMPIFATVFAVSACQPVTETASTTAPEETTMSDEAVVELQPETSSIEANSAESNNVEANSIEAIGENISTHSGHNMPDDAMIPDTVKTSVRYQDYAKSMTAMHNEMKIGMDYNDPDTAFAKSMLGHHRGAIDMANIELKYGKDPYMQKLAQDVIDVQQGEVDILRKWLASHPDIAAPKRVTTAMQRAYDSSAKTMHDDMSAGIADPIADMAFARAMLAHHIGAVKMAKTQLKYGEDKEMRALAKSIIDTQQREIQIMQDWINMQKMAVEESTDPIEENLDASVS